MRSCSRSRRGTPPYPRWAIGAAVLLAAEAAAAQDAAEPIRVAFHAPEGCPDEAAFTGEIAARTAKARLAHPGEAARTFTVAVEVSGKRARGTLAIEDPQGESAAREVSGDTCAEVVSALALIAALAIDPKASTAPTPPPPPPPPPRERPPPPPPYAPIPWWGPIAAPLPVPPSLRPPAHWRWSVGFHAGAASAFAPGVVPVLGADVEALRVRDSVMSPAIRLSVRVADSGFLPSGEESARFRWTVVRLSGCPVRLPALASLDFTPCALFDAGVLDASGVGGAFSLSSTRPWAAPGLSGRFSWDLAAVLPAPMLVELEGGASFPLVRDTFAFFPEGTFHAVPAAQGFFGGGLGVYFP